VRTWQATRCLPRLSAALRSPCFRAKPVSILGEDQHPGDGRSDARLCARVGCGQVAVHTLTADYTDRLMAVGPLSPERTPPALDLCERHSEALTPPEGWRLMRHDPLRES